MATLTQLRPMLDVPDLPATITFWTDVLGFEVLSRIDDDQGRPTWCAIGRDGVQLMFTSHYHDDDPDEEAHVAELTGSLYIDVDDVDAIASDIKGKVDFIFGPEDQPHGMREVAIQDNSGYVVIFGRPTG